MAPLESFAGKDLLSVYTEMHEKGIEKRRTLQAKFSSMRDIRPVTQSVTEEAGENEEDQEKEEDSNDTPAETTEEPEEEAAAGSEGEGEAAEITEEPEEETGDGEEEEEAAEDDSTGDDKEDLPTHNAYCNGCAVRLLLKIFSQID